MPIPKVLHRIWIGGPMPSKYREYGDKWQQLHPDWKIKTWTDQDLRWLRNRAEFDDATQMSAKADIARYEIVYREGGLYVDCDFEPLRAFDEILQGAELVVGEQTPGVYANGLFAAVPGHPVLEYTIECLPESYHSRGGAISPQRTGPAFWTRCVRRKCDELGITPVILRREQVYPYTWTQDISDDVTFPEAYAVHHWAKSWHAEGPGSATGTRWKAVARKSGTRAKRVAHRLHGYWERLEPRSRPHRAVYVGSNRMLVSTSRGFTLFAQADDLGVTPSLVADGHYDLPFAEFTKREVQHGDVCIDVGANIGLFTLEMATAVGGTGRVFAFEPNPDIFPLLQDSVYMNRVRGIMRADLRLRRVAVGPDRGHATLRVPMHNSGMESLQESADPEPVDQKEYDVEVVTLDHILRGIPEIRLLKVDVEGAELGVIRGAKTLIQEGRIRLLDLELIDWKSGQSWTELVTELSTICDLRKPATFAIGPDGMRILMSLATAINSDGLQHFVMEFGG